MTALKYSEHQHQVWLMDWARLQTRAWPELALIFAIPNGGDRNVVVAAKLKAEGVKAGVFDLMLPVARRAFHGLFVEMKAKPNKPSAKQLEFKAGVEAQGYKAVVCYHWHEAMAEITDYLKGV